MKAGFVPRNAAIQRPVGSRQTQKLCSLVLVVSMKGGRQCIVIIIVIMGTP